MYRRRGASLKQCAAIKRCRILRTTLQDCLGRFDASGELRHALWSQTIFQPMLFEPPAPLTPSRCLELHRVLANDSLV